jgi:hypothetical protein
MTWQPIETAPKDGTPVLVFSPHAPFSDPTNIIVAKFDTWRSDPNGEYSWWSYCESVLADISGQIEPEPTHWMPLPPPPTEGGTK